VDQRHASTSEPARRCIRCPARRRSTLPTLPCGLYSSSCELPGENDSDFFSVSAHRILLLPSEPSRFECWAQHCEIRSSVVSAVAGRVQTLTFLEQKPLHQAPSCIEDLRRTLVALCYSGCGCRSATRLGHTLIQCVKTGGN
jgi:hypothetical protein